MIDGVIFKHKLNLVLIIIHRYFCNQITKEVKMAATTTEGTGNGAVERVKPKIYNGVVRTENIDPSTVIASDVADGAVTNSKLADSSVTTGKLANESVTTGKLANESVTVSKMKVFKSSELTGTGVAQNTAHGLGSVPALVIVYPTDTSAATEGVYVSSEGTHTSTEVVVTVTNGKKYRVVAFA